MKKFFVYEVWTRAKVVEAADVQDAYNRAEPEPIEGMMLCNWHAVDIDSQVLKTANAGGLNYRQVDE